MFRSTGFKCVDGEFARLECENNNIIVITRVINGRSNSNNCSIIDDDEMVSEYDHDFKEKCNGGQTCVFKLPKKAYSLGQHKSIESNRINIIYSCVPSKKSLSFSQLT